MNRIALAAFALLPVAFLLACPPAEPPPDNTVTPACTDPTTVVCRDQSLVALNMNATITTAGVVETTNEGDHFHSHIDASVGGLDGKGYIYAKFGADGLTRVELTDDASFDSMDWDISFRRFIIRLNSGTGGPSCVTGARTAPNTVFADLSTVDDNLTFNAEAFMSPDTCDLIPDGSGLGAPGVVLQNFWTYTGCLQMTGFVYVLQLADGHHVKLVVTNFYADAAQTACNTNPNSTDTSGAANIQLDWALLD